MAALALFLMSCSLPPGHTARPHGPIDPPTAEPELSRKQIRDRARNSLLWVVVPVPWTGGKESQGSGVLIDEKSALVVTNHHVTEDNPSSVWAFFPARDRDGNLISERIFVEDPERRNTLEQLGYAVKGRVIAEDPENDLAIVRLDGLPETAREVDYDLSNPPGNYMESDEGVEIFGNPADLQLWRWTAGFYQGIHPDPESGKDRLHLDASIYGGNSGGPVLDERGRLIGVVSQSNMDT